MTEEDGMNEIDRLIGEALGWRPESMCYNPEGEDAPCNNGVPYVGCPCNVWKDDGVVSPTECSMHVWSEVPAYSTDDHAALEGIKALQDKGFDCGMGCSKSGWYFDIDDESAKDEETGLRSSLIYSTRRLRKSSG